MTPDFIHQSPQAVSFVERIQGDDIEDRFRWLEDKDTPATRAFLREEQRIYREYLAQHGSLRAQIESRVRCLLDVEMVDLPVSDHCGGQIYRKRKVGQEQAAIFHSQSPQTEKLILSSETIGRDQYTSLSVLGVSNEGLYLAFGIRFGGEDVQEIGIHDLRNGRTLPDRLPRGFFRGIAFDRDGTGFFYVHDETDGAHQVRSSVRHHSFGMGHTSSTEVFSCGEDRSLRIRLTGSNDSSTLGYTVSSLSQDSRQTLLVHRFPFVESPEEIASLSGAWIAPLFHGSEILAATTHQAPRGRIVRIDPRNPQPEYWTELIPESEDHLHAFELAGERLLVHYSKRPGLRTSIHSLRGTPLLEIRYPVDGTVTLGRVDEPNHQLYYGYSDAMTRFTVNAIDLDTGKTREWWSSSNSVSEGRAIMEQSSCPRVNRTAIPITIIRPERRQDGLPMFLTVYGGNGSDDTPKFSVLQSVLLEAGISCAIAHVSRKEDSLSGRADLQGTVDDLSVTAHWLIEREYTTPLRLGLGGQSHGALVALCAMIQTPRLFRAILALGPITDLLRFHLFGVARWFVETLGSPENPEDLPALLAASPYHGVRRDIEYPAVLVITGDLDRRCDSMHARKMIAALRESGSTSYPIVLDYNEHRGHKPALPLDERIRSLTDRLTFLIAELGGQ